MNDELCDTKKYVDMKQQAKESHKKTVHFSNIPTSHTF